jgi:hypothetical protein
VFAGYVRIFYFQSVNHSPHFYFGDLSFHFPFIIRRRSLPCLFFRHPNDQVPLRIGVKNPARLLILHLPA